MVKLDIQRYRRHISNRGQLLQKSGKVRGKVEKLDLRGEEEPLGVREGQKVSEQGEERQQWQRCIITTATTAERRGCLPHLSFFTGIPALSLQLKTGQDAGELEVCR